MIQLDFMAVLEQWPALLRGAGFTLGLSAVAAVLGVGLGVGCGWARAWGPKPLAAVVSVYVEMANLGPRAELRGQPDPEPQLPCV